MDEYKDIGELFRDKFKDHTIEPSDKVWANIQNNIGNSPATFPKPGLAKYFISSVAVVGVIVAAVGILYFKNLGTTSNIQPKVTHPKEISDNNQQPTTNNHPKTYAQPALKDLTMKNSESIVSIPPIPSLFPKTGTVSDAIASPFTANSDNPIPYAENTPAIKGSTSKGNSAEQLTYNFTSLTDNLKASSVTAKPNDTTVYVGSPFNRKATGSIAIMWSNDTTVCVGSPFNLKVTGGTAIMWSNGSLFEETTFTAPEEEGVYTYRAMVQTPNGDTSIAIKVTTRECHLEEQPNAFTPNGDGKNDKFEPIVPEDCTDFSLMIFNRTGMKIFESKDKDLGWDGKYNNEEQKEGVYFYVIQYRKKSGILKTIRGSVVIVLR